MRRASVLLAVLGALLPSAYSLRAVDQPRSPRPTQAKLSDGEAKPLARRPFLGVLIDAKDDQVKVVRIFPRSSASRSELKVGDAVLAIDETEVTTVADFLSTMKRYRTGDRVKYRIIREKKDSVIEVALTEWPRETASDLDIIYDSVEAKDARLRCILTKPKSAKPGAKLPAVLYIQGIDCASIDAPFASPNPMRELIYDLTRAGFAVMRCEKSGVGDSTGKPCEDLGLHEEVADFVSAVKKLKSYEEFIGYFEDQAKRKPLCLAANFVRSGWAARVAANPLEREARRGQL